MPAYNCQDYVRLAIDSVLNQSYSNIELLIADDASRDNTKAVIDSYTDTRIKKFHNPENLGYLKSCNLLYERATGDYLTFLDADDINNLSRFEKQMEFLNTHSEVDMVGTNIIRIDSDGKETGRSTFSLDDKTIKDRFKNYKSPCHYSSLLIKKKVVHDIGLYNEWFNRIGSEDIYWFSFAIEKYNVANLETNLYYYRKHANSVTATHKNPKAFVGHDLIMFFYKRRSEGKEDYIASGNWKKADACCKFLICMKAIPKGKMRAFFSFWKLYLLDPLIGAQFFRPFFSKLIKG